jgi:hypothetical protein
MDESGESSGGRTVKERPFRAAYAVEKLSAFRP